MLNSKNFGLPQHRERVYIIGNLRRVPRPKVFPFKGSSSKNILPQREYHSTKTLKIRDGSKRGYDIAHVGDSIDLSFLNSTSRRGRVVKGYAHTLVTRVYQYTLTKDGNVRILTPLECERLQGFSDNYTKYNYLKHGISDSQRYKCIGNAVNVPVVREIMKRLVN